MDYDVFIVSRIREAFQRGAGMDEAISLGIKSTASVVTSAAVVMVGVFSIFGTLLLLASGTGTSAVAGVAAPLRARRAVGGRRGAADAGFGVVVTRIPAAARRGRDPDRVVI